MRKRIMFLATIVLIVFVLIGCTSSYESFNLRQLEYDFMDSETPYLLIVAPKEEKNKVTIYYHEDIDGTKEVKQKLKNVTDTDENIIIKTTEETFTFEKVSDSVAVDENAIWYDINYEKNYPKNYP